MSGNAPFLGDAFGESAFSEVAAEAPAAAAETTFGWDHSIEEKPPVFMRAAALTVACVVTAGSYAWDPQPPLPEWTANYGMSNTAHKYEPAKRSVALLGQVAAWPNREPPQASNLITDIFWERWPNPTLPASRSVALLGSVVYAPQVPNVEYQDGWRSRFTDPPKLAARSVELLGDTTIWSPRVADKEYQDGWRSKFQEPVPRAPRSVQLLGQVVWPANVPNVEFQDGWRQEFSKPQRLSPQPRLEGAISWEIRTPETQFQDGWRSSFGEPPKLAPRSVDLLGFTVWPWQTPPAVQVTYQEGWRSLFGEPPKAGARSIALLGQVVWPAQVANVEYQDGWRQEFSKPQRLTPQPRLEGQISWSDRVPEVEYQDGWRAKWQEPPSFLQAKRSVELLYGWSYQALNTAQNAVAVTTEMWHTRWQDPVLPAKRSVNLLGQVIWSARVADVQFQDGWRLKVQDPPAYLLARRSVALLGYTVTARVPDVEYQEGWRSRFQDPPAYLLARRSVGLLGFAVTARVPDVQYQDGWRQQFSEPPAFLKPRRSVALLEGWPWHLGQTYSFLAPTPTSLWFTRWQDPPPSPKRSIALTHSIAWDPQSVTQIAPTTFQDGWRNKWQDPPVYLRARRTVAQFSTPVWPGLGYAFRPVLVCADLPVHAIDWDLQVGANNDPSSLSTSGEFTLEVADSESDLIVASYTFTIGVHCHQEEP